MDALGLWNINFGIGASGWAQISSPASLMIGGGVNISYANFYALNVAGGASVRHCISATFSFVIGAGGAGVGGINLVGGGGGGEQTSGYGTGLGAVGGVQSEVVGVTGELDYSPSSKSVTATLGKLGFGYAWGGGAKFNFYAQACRDLCWGDVVFGGFKPTASQVFDLLVQTGKGLDALESYLESTFNSKPEENGSK